MNAVMKEGCLGYPDNYVIREDPDKQIDVWAKLLPELDARKIIGMLPYSISCGAEDCFVIPKWQSFSPSLAEASEFMLSCLGIEARNVPLGELEQAERTESMLSDISKFQKGHFWLIPAQFGLYRRGESTEQVKKSYGENEFGLDLYLTAACLVSHPERLTGGQWELGINCPGNQDLILSKGGYPKTPYFYSFSRRRVCDLMFSRPNKRFGSATGFFPSS